MHSFPEDALGYEPGSSSRQCKYCLKTEELVQHGAPIGKAEVERQILVYKHESRLYMLVNLRLYCCLPEQHLQPQGGRGRERTHRLGNEEKFVDPTSTSL